MYKSLQATRAIAALLVVLFHLGYTFSIDRYFALPVFGIPFSFGASGVPFFFVLSGFIILSAHRNELFQPHALADYTWKRLTRIYPAYWIVFLGTFFSALAISAMRDKVPHDIAIILKGLLLIPQQLAGNTTGAPVIIVAWTLQYEMFFYLFFACMILSRWLSLVAGAAILSIYFLYRGDPSLPLILSFLSQDYILLFVMGMLMAFITGSGQISIRRPQWYGVTGAILFVIASIDTIGGSDILKTWTTIVYGVASSLIILALVKLEDQGQAILSGSKMQTLGAASYALYLIHFPLIGILCNICVMLHVNRYGFAGAIPAFIVILIICVLVSVAFHLWVERPVAAYLKRIKPCTGQAAYMKAT